MKKIFFALILIICILVLKGDIDFAYIKSWYKNEDIIKIDKLSDYSKVSEEMKDKYFIENNYISCGIYGTSRGNYYHSSTSSPYTIITFSKSNEFEEELILKEIKISKRGLFTNKVLYSESINESFVFDEMIKWSIGSVKLPYQYKTHDVIRSKIIVEALIEYKKLDSKKVKRFIYEFTPAFEMGFNAPLWMLQ